MFPLVGRLCGVVAQGSTHVGMTCVEPGCGELASAKKRRILFESSSATTQGNTEAAAVLQAWYKGQFILAAGRIGALILCIYVALLDLVAPEEL